MNVLKEKCINFLLANVISILCASEEQKKTETKTHYLFWFLQVQKYVSVF